MATCLKKANRPYGKTAMGLILHRMRNGAGDPFVRATMRKFTSAKSAEIGIQRMSFMTVGAKSVCASPSTMTHSLSM